MRQRWAVVGQPDVFQHQRRRERMAERHRRGEVRYYVSNLPESESATLLRLARQLKRRWSCEQAHEKLKQKLGLDHFEGRNWNGLHHHALLTMIAFCFLQFLRLGGKKGGSVTGRRPSPACWQSDVS